MEVKHQSAIYPLEYTIDRSASLPRRRLVRSPADPKGVKRRFIDSEEYARLLPGIRLGDVSAWRKLDPFLIRYGHGILRRVGVHSQNHDEYLQDCMVRAYIGSNKLRDTTNFNAFKAWYGRIITNYCYDARRRNNPQEILTSFSGEEQSPLLREVETLQLAAYDIGTANEIRNDKLGETADRILAAARRVDQRRKDQVGITIECVPIMEEIMKGSTLQEIADRLGVGMGTVKSRIHRAKILVLAEMQNSPNAASPF